VEILLVIYLEEIEIFMRNVILYLKEIVCIFLTALLLRNFIFTQSFEFINLF